MAHLIRVRALRQGLSEASSRGNRSLTNDAAKRSGQL